MHAYCICTGPLSLLGNCPQDQRLHALRSVWFHQEILVQLQSRFAVKFPSFLQKLSGILGMSVATRREPRHAPKERKTPYPRAGSGNSAVWDWQRWALRQWSREATTPQSRRGIMPTPGVAQPSLWGGDRRCLGGGPDGLFLRQSQFQSGWLFREIPVCVHFSTARSWS